MGFQRKLSRPGFVEHDTAVDAVRNPAGSFSTAERSYDYLAGLRDRRSGARGYRRR